MSVFVLFYPSQQQGIDGTYRLESDHFEIGNVLYDLLAIYSLHIFVAIIIVKTFLVEEFIVDEGGVELETFYLYFCEGHQQADLKLKFSLDKKLLRNRVHFGNID